jgi:hypothetical protein
MATIVPLWHLHGCSNHSRSISRPLIIHSYPTFKTATVLESGCDDGHLAPLIVSFFLFSGFHSKLFHVPPLLCIGGTTHAWLWWQPGLQIRSEGSLVSLWCEFGFCSSSKLYDSATTGLQTLHGSILSLCASIVSIHGPLWLHFEPLQLLSFDFNAYGIRIQLFTVMRIRIRLAKIMRIRIRNLSDSQTWRRLVRI